MDAWLWIEQDKSMTEKSTNKIRTDEVGGVDSARAGGRTVSSAGTSGTSFSFLA